MVDRSGSEERKSKAGMSTWVKVTLIVLTVIVVVVVATMVVSSGGIGGHQIPEHAPPLGSAEGVPATRSLR